MKKTSSGNSSDLSIGSRYQLLVTSISDYAIYMLDVSGIVDSWNAGAQRFKGYTEQEIIGKHFSHFYIPEDQAAGVPAKALETALREGKFEAEGWRVRKDGTRFWASVVIDPIYDGNGRHIGFAKITRDVTARKQSDDALLESERRFRLLVQGVTDYAIYMLSPEGLVTNWNEGAQRIKGFEEREVINTHFSRFYTQDDQTAQLPAKALATAAKVGRFESEGRRIRKDGTQFWAHVVIDAIYDDQHELIGFAKITRDITERKAAQEELERANAALFQSQKMEAIGQLTGGVAHDFNNLLGVVASGLDLIGADKLSHSELKVVESMRRAIERGATLTQQLLSFARKQPLKVDNYNLNAVISTFEPVLRRAGKADIKFSVNLKAALSTVAIDAARFEAALLNLLVNARDAMPDGGEITLTTENVVLAARQIGDLPAGTYIKVEVTDTGSGMPEDVKKRAFEPFFTTKELGKGTGLGLSQVYGFMTQSGGDIQLHSVPGKGTRICLYLPVTQEAVEVANSVGDELSDLVLLVEDEQDLLEVAAELVRSIGYDVVTATNGSDALALLNSHPSINILFTDIIMPNGINGVELARTAKAQRPDLKIVLASGYPLPALRAEHGDLDEYEFMNKPYKLADLARKLRAA
jgi:PAS domain S-box-containing protein